MHKTLNLLKLKRCTFSRFLLLKIDSDKTKINELFFQHIINTCFDLMFTENK